jgi:catalase
MLLWITSDRAIPRSLRMMQGFGVHTFRLVNARGVSVFCKFHWKPLLGTHSLVWDEAVKIAGADADFHRRDLLVGFCSTANSEIPRKNIVADLFLDQENAHDFCRNSRYFSVNRKLSKIGRLSSRIL